MFACWTSSHAAALVISPDKLKQWQFRLSFWSSPDISKNKSEPRNNIEGPTMLEMC
jgi:hypothetical protein